MKKHFLVNIFVIGALVLTALLSSLHSANAESIPVLTIKSVDEDKSVTVYGYNFPAGQTFTVKMGPYGTYALGGSKVGSLKIEKGGSFTKTYDIPSGLKGDGKIAIRMDSPQGFYSYNWFYNNPDAPVETPPVPGYTGYPTFNISAVEKNVSVSIVTYNLPAGQVFTVRMGEYGTLGVDGIVVGSLDSGKGGTLTPSFNIPAKLKDRGRIAIRMDCPAGLYAYNWFYNNNAVVGTNPAPGYIGIPTITINAVVKDGSVTLTGHNFPPDETFTVRMGEYGTYALGGKSVATYESGEGKDFTKTYTIPSSLAGRSQIAIRFETSNGYYYAFNWFWNNTTN